MAASLNKVILIGNLTADPELSYTGSGTARARFAIAINRRYKDATGQLKDETTFVPIVVWGTQAENCANYLAKGRSVAVEGRLRIDSFENSEGERKKVIEVVANNIQFLGGPRSPDPGTSQPAPSQPEPAGKDTKSPDEEVPF